MGDGRFAVVKHGEFPARLGVTADRRIDGALDGIRQALHHGVVGLFHAAVLKGVLERGISALRGSHDHHARGAHIEAMHDALALGRPRRSDGIAGRAQPANHRRPVPTHAGVCGHAHRLMHADNIGIAVEHVHALDQLFARQQRLFWLRQKHRDHVAGGQPLGLAQLLGIDGHVALGAQLRGGAPGKAKELG